MIEEGFREGQSVLRILSGHRTAGVVSAMLPARRKAFAHSAKV